MSDQPIFFEFEQERSAFLAMDTLQELGYKSGFVDGTGKTMLHVHVDGQDVTSALEIAQAYGGRLTEHSEAMPEERLYQMAYDLDEGIRIPAHFVNEDFSESYVQPGATEAGGSPDAPAAPLYDEFDPSEETYDGFSPGVHL
ncbi:hypothetical protein SD70_20880 [Gordoniibacillus kamchatkensis]|uniref:Uncharacterized protein n=1 Tax=Gordoniibacillus kamchatkensis TaxID=1590651 RepID=A0ABR5AFB7_9BACL|nr:hypothetical protein [Paenibacillus sp. VKM B-2647]KIL39265.1 hypothetical protein SD70_20880 [Paenibacillus sp. VKM B-2647]